MPESVAVTIYHNPSCGTSRNVLALIRNAGVDPTVVQYLKTPPDRGTLKSLIERMGVRPRDLLRNNGAPDRAWSGGFASRGNRRARLHIAVFAQIPPADSPARWVTYAATRWPAAAACNRFRIQRRSNQVPY
jgi:arsenate reductase-like glutaredoxin family protein